MRLERFGSKLRDSASWLLGGRTIVRLIAKVNSRFQTGLLCNLGLVEKRRIETEDGFEEI